MEALVHGQAATASQYRSALAALEDAVNGLVYENLPGDLNDDHVVNVLDMMTMAQIVVGKVQAPEGIVIDFNGDHSIDLLDVMTLAQVVNGSITL